MRSLLLVSLTALAVSASCQAVQGADGNNPPDLSDQVCKLYTIASTHSQDVPPPQQQPVCPSCVSVKPLPSVSKSAPSNGGTSNGQTPPCAYALENLAKFATFDTRLSAIDALG